MRCLCFQKRAKNSSKSAMLGSLQQCLLFEGFLNLARLLVTKVLDAEKLSIMFHKADARADKLNAIVGLH